MKSIGKIIYYFTPNIAYLADIGKIHSFELHLAEVTRNPI